MSEQLLSLADQAQLWHSALLRTTTEIAALGSPEDRPGHDRPGAAPAVGTAAVLALLTQQLAGAGGTTWLRTGAAEPQESAGDSDPVAELLLRNAPGVRVLLGGMGMGSGSGGAGDGGTAQRLGPVWTDSAADVRVAPGLPSRGGPPSDLVLTDRNLALTVSSTDDGQLRADTVTDPVILGILRSVWEALWARALPLASAVRLDSLAGDGVKRALLEQLETGTKDEVIARALGISLRTCRRHIAELLTAAGAVSRFQAGSRLAQAGLFRVPSH